MEVRSLTADTTALDVVGELTGGSESELMEVFAQAEDAKTVVLNFSGLEYMNSSGIGLLVTLLVRAKRQKQTLVACGLSAHYREIFELTRLDEAIAIHDTETDALA